MKKLFVMLAVAGLFLASKSSAVSFDDVQFWIGSGTNRAALVVEWSTPESFSNSIVPAPIADKSLVWGYRFNGTNATAAQMLEAIAAADPKLYFVADDYYSGSTFIDGIGYNLNGDGGIGITDGTSTNYFTNGFAWDVSANVDAAAPLNNGDLYWSGSSGPNWESWNELGDNGGFFNCPNRGTNSYWTPDDTNNPYFGEHGQWEYAQAGLDYLKLTNGSWIGFSVAAAGYYGDTDAYNMHKHAPALPDMNITAVIKNISSGLQNSQWQAQFLSVSNWLYTLQRTTNFVSWSDVMSTNGNSVDLLLQDTNPPSGNAFYRVKAEHP